MQKRVMIAMPHRRRNISNSAAKFSRGSRIQQRQAFRVTQWDKETRREDITGGTFSKLSKGTHSCLIESQNVMNYCLPNNAGRYFRSKQDKLIYRSCRRHRTGEGDRAEEERRRKKKNERHKEANSTVSRTYVYICTHRYTYSLLKFGYLSPPHRSSLIYFLHQRRLRVM